MKASEEFVKGKNGIGYVENDFKKVFGDQEFELRPMPTFQKLGKDMSDSQIEAELKPGLCTLGDVLSFIRNAPEECKDGYSNIFYFADRVVGVFWRDGEWHVYTWSRVGLAWLADGRVISPATDAQKLSTSPSETLTLDDAIKIIRQAGQLLERLEKIEAWIDKWETYDSGWRK